MPNQRIKCVKTGGDGRGQNYREYIITAASDVADLPNSKTAAPDTADIGSIAYTQDMEHTYMLGPDDTWREV